jgi:hypothetical protein
MSEAFLTEIPPRPEAILKGVAHAWETNDAVTRSAVSSLEAPSAVFSAKLIYPEVEILVNEVPEPDPRVPFEDVDVQAWEYEDTTPSPAFPQPPPHLVDAIKPTIAGEFSLDNWAAAARQLHGNLGPISPCEILGLATCPPEYPEGSWPWDWLFRSQLLSLLMLAMAEEDPWVESPAGKHVLDVVHGPVDWTTTAALVGLTARARHDPACREGILAELMRLLERPMSPIWFMCAYKPIWQLLQHFPGLDAEMRNTVGKTVAELEAEEY